MTRIKPEPAHPNLSALIEIPAEHQDRYVIVGLVDVQPNGVDVRTCTLAASTLSRSEV